MNIVILDDNVNDSKKLKDYINRFFLGSLIRYVIKTYSSGEEFLQNSDLQNIDVMFLDIFIGSLTGIDIARRVRESNQKCIIVFVSSSNSFATESYEVNALNYLTKPFNYTQFDIIMRKVDDKALKNSLYFDLRQYSGINRVMVDKIIFVDYYNHYVQIHTLEEVISSYVVTFTEVADTLLKYSNFLSCYRNVLINMDKVAKLEDRHFIMTTNENIPLNRARAKEIKQTYHSYIYSKLGGTNDVYL